MVAHRESLEWRKNDLGICSNDFRIFWDYKSNTWILANDFKMRTLINKGYSKRSAKNMSHGHLKKKKHCKLIKEDILSNSRPKSRDIWLLGCYVRVADDSYIHYNWVCGLYDSKKKKENKSYYNVGYGKVHSQRT